MLLLDEGVMFTFLFWIIWILFGLLLLDCSIMFGSHLILTSILYLISPPHNNIDQLPITKLLNTPTLNQHINNHHVLLPNYPCQEGTPW